MTAQSAQVLYQAVPSIMPSTPPQATQLLLFPLSNLILNLFLGPSFPDYCVAAIKLDTSRLLIMRVICINERTEEKYRGSNIKPIDSPLEILCIFKLAIFPV